MSLSVQLPVDSYTKLVIISKPIMAVVEISDEEFFKRKIHTSDIRLHNLSEHRMRILIF